MAVFLLKMTESFGKKYGPRMVRINYRLSSVKKYLGGIFQASKRGLRGFRAIARDTHVNFNSKIGRAHV